MFSSRFTPLLICSATLFTTVCVHVAVALRYAHEDYRNNSTTFISTGGNVESEEEEEEEEAGYEEEEEREDSYIEPYNDGEGDSEGRKVSTFGAFPPGFTVETKSGGFGVAIGMVWIDRKRALILEKSGNVWICDTDAPVFSGEKYMVIPQTHLYNTDETGALAIAVDPDFNAGGSQAKKHVYIYYGAVAGVDGLAGGMRLARFSHNENQGGLSSRGGYSTAKIIWHDTDGWRGNPQWHYGGALVFGPEKKLFLTLGDKYSRGCQLSNEQHCGCILRLNRDGSIPSGNLPPSVKPAACWAYGIRNGFTAYWDVSTDRFLIAEVGGNNNKKSQEDVHLGKAGVNYGWPFCEGDCNNPKFPGCSCDHHDAPIYTYDRTQYQEGGGKAAIIGGPVLRNSGWPARYKGAYFHGDFARGDLSFIEFEHDGSEKVERSTKFGDMQGPIFITKDPLDNLWVTTYKGRRGALFKISYNSDNRAPVISAVFASVSSGPPPLKVAFVGAASDPEGYNNDLEYTWHLGDGTTLDGENVFHTFTKRGSFVAQMFVSDGTTTVGSDAIEIIVGELPKASILSPLNGQTFRAGETIVLEGTGMYSKSGAYIGLPAENLQWHFGFIHDTHVHPVGGTSAGSTATYTVPTSGHSFGSGTGLRFELTASSPDSTLQAVTRIELWPELVKQRVVSDPSGIAVLFDNEAHVTPFEVETIVGFEHEFKVQSVCYNNVKQTGTIVGPYNPSTGVVRVPDDGSAVTVYLTADAIGGSWCAGPSKPICATAALNTALTLDCSSYGLDYAISSVTHASFGVPNYGGSDASCGEVENGVCHASTSQAVVEEACLGQAVCSIAVSYSTFNNECSPESTSLGAFTDIGMGWCRGADGATDNTGIFPKGTAGMASAEECQNKCKEQPRCTGVWYNDRSTKCELHAIPLTAVTAKNNVRCYARNEDILSRSAVASVVCEQIPPIAAPTVTPTATPTAVTTAAPTATPTVAPTAAPTAAPTGVITASCVDAHADCSYWSHIGECESNPGYMHAVCSRSCGACHQKEATINPTRTATTITSTSTSTSTSATIASTEAPLLDPVAVHQSQIVVITTLTNTTNMTTKSGLASDVCGARCRRGARESNARENNNTAATDPKL